MAGIPGTTFHGTAGDDNLTGTPGNDTFLLAQGGEDTASGEGGNDTFIMGATLNSGDQINGGTGTDVVVLTGNYTGDNSLTFDPTTMVNVEFIRLGAGHSYDLTTDDATVAAGATLTVRGGALGEGNSLTFDGSAETDGHFVLIGGAGNDVLTGGQNGDSFHLESGGEDTATGGAGNDEFDVGAALDAGDTINGGLGRNVLRLDGDYSAGLTLGPDTIANIQVVQFANGYSYDLTVDNANFLSGPTYLINAEALTGLNGLGFDASASDAGFHFIGGAGADVLTGGSAGSYFDLSQGGNDTATGGARNDTFYMGAALTTGDVIDGGGGFNVLILNGDYSGGFDFDNTAVTNINSVKLQGNHSYDITVQDAFTPASGTLVVNGEAVGASNTVTIDGSAVVSDSLTLLGGAGNDVLIGGAGFDTFTGGGGADTMTGNGGDNTYVYHAASQSTSTGYDTITDFNFNNDTIVSKAGPITGYSYVETGTLSTATFDSDLASAVSGLLTTGHAVVFEPDSGTLAGQAFLVVNENGTAGYQAGHDLVIDITGYVGFV